MKFPKLTTVILSDLNRIVFILIFISWLVSFCAFFYTNQALVKSHETNKALIEANNVLLKRTSDDEDRLLNLRASNDQLRADSKMWKDYVNIMCAPQPKGTNSISALLDSLRDAVFKAASNAVLPAPEEGKMIQLYNFKEIQHIP